MFRFARFPLFALALSVAALCQTSPKDSRPNAATLLQQVKEKYAQAKYYNIEAIEEFETAGELDRQWSKSVIKAAFAQGNRYRFEGQNQGGWSLKISDGKTEWMVDAAASLYTQKPVLDEGPSRFTRVEMNQFVLYSAQYLTKSLSASPGSILNPAYLADETLTFNGKQLPCYVVGGPGRYLSGSRDSTWQFTFWIEKETLAIRKVHVRGEGSLIANVPHYRIVQDTTTVYPTAELDSMSLPDAAFKFAPSAGARLVEKLPDPSMTRGTELIGKMAPEVKLQSADGRTVALSGLRGKPVLLEFWATWCAPCVSSLPLLGKLLTETSGKGLVLLSIDEDVEAKTAADLWAKHGVSWPNFHDGDGEIHRAFAPGGVPQLVLIDASGKITFALSGFDESQLRVAIANLGPEFASLREKPKP